MLKNQKRITYNPWKFKASFFFLNMFLDFFSTLFSKKRILLFYLVKTVYKKNTFYRLKGHDKKKLLKKF